MVGVVLTYAMTMVTAAPGALATPGDICAPGEVCQPLAQGAPAGDAGYRDGGWIYATPAEVDCRGLERAAGTTTGGRGDADQLFGVCSQPAWDFRYRVSRFPDGERQNGAFAPQRRGIVRSVVPSTNMWRGLPLDRGTVTPAGLPPLAVYATAACAVPNGLPSQVAFRADGHAPFRTIDPLERPPRG